MFRQKKIGCLSCLLQHDSTAFSYTVIEGGVNMRNDTKNRQCMSVVGSMTQAMQAKKRLDAASVYTQIVKADSAEGGQGCSYALSYSCPLAESVKQILTRAGIRIHATYGDGK